ncbi:MAG: hypothetical protein M0Z41_01345 [Peptococcaceae bacterium]|jgi:hypothetical protein|nr:hypothetical protein [Peptococcaceae bacterium]
MIQEKRTVLRLGRNVLIWPVRSYPVPGKRQYFTVDWPSYWDEEYTIEVGVVAVRNRSGRWKVVELELPEDISEGDADDIVLSFWYVFDSSDKQRKSPPVQFAWDFNNPKVVVVACERPTGEKQINVAMQISKMQRF